MYVILLETLQLTPVILNSEISQKSSYIKEYSLDIFPDFLDNSTLDTSNCWYLEVNFLEPENLL